MVARLESASLFGLQASRVWVEVSLARGFPTFSLVGLPDAAVRESKDRVLAAIRNSGFQFPPRRVTINLAPAEVRKEGSHFDLAMALGILLAGGSVALTAWPKAVWLGELGLDGAIRRIRGALPLVRRLAEAGWNQFVLPEENAREVAFLPHISVVSFGSLREVVEWLEKGGHFPATNRAQPWVAQDLTPTVDMAHVKGQVLAKRALEIAAAGWHNLLMIGCPGTGKSMLAQAFPGLLPPWTLDEALEASQVHSLISTQAEPGLLSRRPFRAPHHSASLAALIGGGDVPAPGEISLAHRGVLFLDELPEFRRDALEALREPLETGDIHIHRARGRASYPAQFRLVAAMNPCPCGYRGHPTRDCICPPRRVQHYLAKVSGPLLDRIDLHVEVPVLKTDELFAETVVPENSAAVRERVLKAWERQRQRFPKRSPFCNSALRPVELRHWCRLDDASTSILKQAVDRLGLSGRAFDRIRRLARTIADLAGEESIRAAHVAEAIQYRALDRPAKELSY